jgi:hypothetical protein
LALMENRLLLEYAGIAIGIASDHAEHVDWLKEFLEPSFVSGGDISPERGSLECEVRLRLDDAAFARQLAGGPSGEEAVCFEMDTRVVRLPVWRSKRPGRVVVRDQSGRVFYGVDPARRIVDVLGPASVEAGDVLAVRIGLMRVVREIAMHAAVARSGFFLHAAGFALEGGAVVVAGPKRAGKSTLLLYALSAAPGALLSNDRLLLSPRADRFLVTGMPTITTLRPGTLEFFPTILESLLSSGFHTGVTVAEARELSGDQRGKVGPAPDGRYGISNRQLCEIIPCEAQTHAPARAILFPRVTPGTEVLTLVQATADEAVHELRQSLFGRQADRPGDPLFRLSLPPGGHYPDVAEACLALASNVQCYFCDTGPGSFAQPASKEALLARLGSR